MLPSVARCASAQPLLLILLLALAREGVAQTDERDAVIEELRHRIEVLEKRLEDKPAPPPPPPAVTQPPSPPAPKPSASEDAGRADESARALERSLVREGGLVLPSGAIEVEPRLQYTYRASEGLRIVTAGAMAQVAEQDTRSDELEASLGIRVGLPGSFQAEMRLPYAWIDENRATSSTLSESQRASGRGGLELGLSKQLLAEGRGRLGLLASLNWKSAIGHDDLGRLSPGSGFPQLQAALTAVKREDPLVFFGTASYTAVLERERGGSDVNPGDAIGLRAGALLAASPETSLRAGLDLSRVGRTRIGGAGVPGSDATVGVLELGVARLLSQRTLLDVQLGVGVTPDAPDFRLRLSVPIRF
jgi:hypothetical protein